MNVSVYILKCSDDSYYVGCTNNLDRRLKDHNDGLAADWTARRRPVTLVYVEDFPDLLLARRREGQLKGWSRVKKEKLITGVWKQHGRVA